MEIWPIILVVVGVASRPIEVRLWRAGRLSDRALAALLLGRFPVLVGLLAILSSVPPPLIVVAIAISVLPGLFFCRVVLDHIREQSRSGQESLLAERPG